MINTVFTPCYMQRTALKSLLVENGKKNLATLTFATCDVCISAMNYSSLRLNQRNTAILHIKEAKTGLLALHKY